MMSTQQMIRERQNASGSKSWQEMFPNPQLSEQTSATFLKKLVAIAISNITYLRNIFPEGAFADRYLEGLNLKVLRDDGCYPTVSQLIRWIKGSFEALDHKFLRQLIIGIYNDPSNPNDVLETYSFHFSYTNKTLSGCSYYQDDGKNKREVTTHKFVSPEDTFRQTISLFRHCIMCTHSLRPLPQDSMINMRLLYYDDVTPENYEPPGFKSSPVSSYTFVNKPILLNLGETKTPWHGMKLLLATDASDFEVAAEKDSTTGTTEVANKDTSKPNQKGLSHQPNKSPVHKTPVPEQSAVNKKIPESQNAVVPSVSPAQPASAVSTTGSSWAETNEPDGQEVQIRCPCGVALATGLLMVCTKCKMWQHANCFKVLTEDEIPQSHICELCDSPSIPCTDATLPSIMPSERKEICLYQRALGLCNESYRVGGSDLIENLGMDADVARRVMLKLDKDGVFKLTNKRSKGKFRLINKLKLKKTLLPEYFSRVQEAPDKNEIEDTQEKYPSPRCQKELTTQESPEPIEALTEKLSLSQTRDQAPDTAGNKGKKRSLLSVMKGTEDGTVSEYEYNMAAKKKFKVSVPEEYSF